MLYFHSVYTFYNMPGLLTPKPVSKEAPPQVVCPWVSSSALPSEEWQHTVASSRCCCVLRCDNEEHQVLSFMNAMAPTNGASWIRGQTPWYVTSDKCSKDFFLSLITFRKDNTGCVLGMKGVWAQGIHHLPALTTPNPDFSVAPSPFIHAIQTRFSKLFLKKLRGTKY